jgi:ferredoxin
LSEKIPLIDEEAGIGCGACEKICPEAFRLNEPLGFALVITLAVLMLVSWKRPWRPDR